MKPTLIVLCLLSCVTLIQGQFGWFDLDFDDKFDKKKAIQSCTTEYDDIHSEKCDTKYHLSCVKATETVCRPTQVTHCNPEPIESCSFVNEDKCMSVPIPSCDVTWHKVCKDKLVCSKTFEVTVPDPVGKFWGQDPPPPVYKEPVPTGGSGVPVGPIINNPDVSVEVTPQEENVEEVTVDEGEFINDEEINPDEIIEGPEGPMINRRKRSLSEMVAGAAVLKKKLKLKKLGAKIGIAGISAAAIAGVIPEKKKKKLKLKKIAKKIAKIEIAGISAAAAISGIIPGVSGIIPGVSGIIPGVSGIVSGVSGIIPGVSVGPPRGAPINNRQRRSLDEDGEVEETEEYEDLEEIETPFESEEDHGERHKRSLVTGIVLEKKLKLKKLGAKIGIAGISAAAIAGINNRRRRSPDEDGEVEETEEYEDLEEIETLPYESEEDHGERHKRSLVTGTVLKEKLKLKKLGAKIGIAGISAAAIAGVIPGVSVGPPINNRRRRSLDEDGEVEETEEYEDLEEIETLPIPAGYSMPYESEEDHGERHKRGLPDFSWTKKKPVKNCVTQKKCTNVPKRDCGIQKKETCIPFPKKKCETKYIEKCYTVTRQECGEAVNKKCTSIPTKDCKKVIERRPRLVCPPPPTVERIQEPVFTKEVPIEGSGVPVGPIINN